MTHDVQLNPSDAIELAELLTFISDWLDSPDRPRLETSLNQFIDHRAYDLYTLQTDLARFAFLLGDDGEQLFGPNQP